MKEVAKRIRASGIRMVFYLDNFIFFADSKKECVLIRDQVLELLRSLGWTIQEEECVLEPTQVIEFLGFEVNSKNMKLFVPREKIYGAKRALNRLLKMEKIKIRELASVLGLLNSFAAAILPTRMRY
jgi:hypothetical protein